MGYADRVPNRDVMSKHQRIRRGVPILGSTDCHLAAAVLASARCGLRRLRGSEPAVLVAVVAARRIDGLQLLEIELGNRLQLVGERRSLEVGGQVVEPSPVFLLQRDERTDGDGPADGSRQAPHPRSVGEALSRSRLGNTGSLSSLGPALA